DVVGADRIDRVDAVGDEDGVAAHEIVAALKEDGVESAVGAEVIRHEQLRDASLEHQIIAGHGRDTADPVGGSAEIAIGAAVPKPRSAVGRWQESGSEEESSEERDWDAALTRE